MDAMIHPAKTAIAGNRAYNKTLAIVDMIYFSEVQTSEKRVVFSRSSLNFEQIPEHLVVICDGCDCGASVKAIRQTEDAFAILALDR